MISAFSRRSKTARAVFACSSAAGSAAKHSREKCCTSFLPEADLLDCAQAVVTVFSRHGNRENLFRARLKYLIEEIGLDGFEKLYATEFQQLAEDAARRKTLPQPTEIAAPDLPPQEDFEPPAELKDWFTESVRPQKEAGYFFVTAGVPLGDATPATLLALADLAEKFNIEVRTTIRQNFAFANCAGKDLPAIHAALDELKLAESRLNCAGGLISCPGTSSCNLAITNSKELGRELVRFLAETRPDLGKLRNVKINISGCPNSCGMHRVADIGLQGAALVQPITAGSENKVIPSYEIYLGTRTAAEDSVFGEVAAKVPAKNALSAIAKILDEFVAQKKADETFADFAKRHGRDNWKKLLAPFIALSEQTSTDDYRQDFGDTQPFELKLGRGECAGEVISLIQVGLADAQRTAHLAEQALEGNDTEAARAPAAEKWRSIDPRIADFSRCGILRPGRVGARIRAGIDPQRKIQLRIRRLLRAHRKSPRK